MWTRADRAAVARSVLACARDVTLVADGVSTAAGAGCDARCDLQGMPVVSFPEGSEMVVAAQGLAAAELTVTSGLGRRGDAERALVLVMSGHLRDVGVESCTCCDDRRHTVRLEVERITLLDDGRQPCEIDVARFRDPGLALNRGHLQRTVEHANDVHEQQLRESVAWLLQRPVEALLTASLTQVDPGGCTVQWVDARGSHQRHVPFVVPVRTPAELTTALGLALDPR